MSTRDQILTYLARHQTASAAQISHALQLSAADIRHHLAGLARAGMVQRAGTTSTGERGRPRQLYRLTPQARQHNLVGLAHSLLNHLLAAGNVQELDQLAKRLANFDPSATSQAQRLVQAIKRLNELEYEARWEAHAGAPVILFGNCPYAPLIDQHPELCQMDAALIAHLSGLNADQTAKLKPNSLGALQCMFRIVGRTES